MFAVATASTFDNFCGLEVLSAISDVNFENGKRLLRMLTSPQSLHDVLHAASFKVTFAAWMACLFFYSVYQVSNLLKII